MCALENALLFPNNSDNSVGTFALKGPRLNNPTKKDVTPRMLTSFVKIRLDRETLIRKYFKFYNKGSIFIFLRKVIHV